MNTNNDAWKIVYDHVKVKYTEKFGSVTEWYKFLEACDRNGVCGADVVKIAIDRLTKNQVIVHVVEGKNDSVDYITVKFFPDTISARRFCTESFGGGKYWKICEVVDKDERIDLSAFKVKEK